MSTVIFPLIEERESVRVTVCLRRTRIGRVPRKARGPKRTTGTMLNNEAAARTRSLSALPLCHHAWSESSQGSPRGSKIPTARAAVAAMADRPKMLRSRRCRTTCPNGVYEHTAGSVHAHELPGSTQVGLCRGARILETAQGCSGRMSSEAGQRSTA